jgi:hypothetical protein
MLEVWHAPQTASKSALSAASVRAGAFGLGPRTLPWSPPTVRCAPEGHTPATTHEFILACPGARMPFSMFRCLVRFSEPVSISRFPALLSV